MNTRTKVILERRRTGTGGAVMPSVPAHRPMKGWRLMLVILLSAPLLAGAISMVYATVYVVLNW